MIETPTTLTISIEPIMGRLIGTLRWPHILILKNDDMGVIAAVASEAGKMTLVNQVKILFLEQKCLPMKAGRFWLTRPTVPAASIRDSA